jgi:energy-coupling factor transporter ATP-binding protein EcfA2
LLELDQRFDWFEFRPGELTVWTGFNGHGKSLLLSQVQLGLMQQGERFVIFSGEMTPEYLLKRMVKQATGPGSPDAGLHRRRGRVAARSLLHLQPDRQRHGQAAAGGVRLCAQALRRVTMSSSTR